MRYNSTTSCFTATGDDGMEIEMIDGRKFFIGTQNVEGLKEVIEKLAV